MIVRLQVLQQNNLLLQLIVIQLQQLNQQVLNGISLIIFLVEQRLENQQQLHKKQLRLQQQQLKFHIIIMKILMINITIITILMIMNKIMIIIQQRLLQKRRVQPKLRYLIHISIDIQQNLLISHYLLIVVQHQNP